MESGATPRVTRILITGPPAIGKTTICKNVLKLLLMAKCNVDGFYTEEIRSENKARIGFDIVPLKNPDKKIPLARIKTALKEQKRSEAKVGAYEVFVDDFEKSALLCLDIKSDVLMIDEIGKMELFSKKFYKKVEELFFTQPNELCIIATIPSSERIPFRYAEFFERMKNDPWSQVIEVNHQNRDILPKKIVDLVSKMIPNSFINK